jgi:hypothetical protein
VKLHADGGFKCFSADGCVGKRGGAVDLLVEHAGLTFPEAVSALLGHSVPAKLAKRAPATLVNAPDDGFAATCDTEVYDALVAYGDVDAAAAYYGAWHITPEAVAEVGVTLLPKPERAQKRLLDQFGRDRLVAAGLIVPRDGKPDFWVVNRRYSVVEPHRGRDGSVVGLQTRPSPEHLVRYNAHATYHKARQAALAAGETFREPRPNERYVPKFFSLRGGVVGVHLIGCGLPRLAGLEDGTTVYLVEGMKDLLAMRSMGFEGYALPGTGIAPPPTVVAELARFRLAVAYDADDGGDAGSRKVGTALARGGVITDELAAEWATAYPHDNPMWSVRYGLEHLGLQGDALQQAGKVATERQRQGWGCKRKRPPQGMDVADVLVSRHAAHGCTCPTCTAWRETHPDDQPN